MRRPLHVAVVGAGAFGGWTALELVQRGARVTLIDAWGPGNPRASSGGETRVIRASYGTRSIYTRMAKRAYARWSEADASWGTALFRKTGGLWMFTNDDAFGRGSADALAAEGLPFEWWTPKDIAERFPQISTNGVSAAIWEPDAGTLWAQHACEVVADRVVAAGGTLESRQVTAPVDPADAARGRLRLDDGDMVSADAFVFACGPWLGNLFPDVIGDAITPTRQEVYYFGTPQGDTRYTAGALPVWVEFDDRMRYGIPGSADGGFKFADDTSGDRFDPTTGSRIVSADGAEKARDYLRYRFPGLGDAPLLRGEVCQYEATPDSDFLIARHPGAANVWIAGGGSGHGFKMGPVVGEIVTAALMEDTGPDPRFGLDRLTRRGVIPTLKEKWS